MAIIIHIIPVLTASPSIAWKCRPEIEFHFLWEPRSTGSTTAIRRSPLQIRRDGRGWRVLTLHHIFYARDHQKPWRYGHWYRHGIPRKKACGRWRCTTSWVLLRHSGLGLPVGRTAPPSPSQLGGIYQSGLDLVIHRPFSCRVRRHMQITRYILP